MLEEQKEIIDELMEKESHKVKGLRSGKRDLIQENKKMQGAIDQLNNEIAELKLKNEEKLGNIVKESAIVQKDLEIQLSTFKSEVESYKCELENSNLCTQSLVKEVRHLTIENDLFRDAIDQKDILIKELEDSYKFLKEECIQLKTSFDQAQDININMLQSLASQREEVKKIEAIMKKNSEVSEKRDTEIEKLIAKIGNIENKAEEVLSTATVVKGKHRRKFRKVVNLMWMRNKERQ